MQGAFEGGHYPVIDLLLVANAALWFRSPVPGAAMRGTAAREGHGTDVERLLKGVYQGSRTGLQATAEGSGAGNIVAVERLLQVGADVNAPPAKFDGRTVLQASAGGGHREVFELLLRAGSDVNAITANDHGRTALQVAAEGGHGEPVEILLQAGADVDGSPSKPRPKVATRR